VTGAHTLLAVFKVFLLREVSALEAADMIACVQGAATQHQCHQHQLHTRCFEPAHTTAGTRQASAGLWASFRTMLQASAELPGTSDGFHMGVAVI
jgi:hypothetical protein